jgi:tellurite resistance protein
MKLTIEQSRTMVALACSVAWADGVVTQEERDFVRSFVHRFAGSDVDPGELEQWLRSGPPQARLDSLPKEMSELFFYEAMRLAEADGVVSVEEEALLEGLMLRVFERHPEGAVVAKVKLVKRRA